jgi:hypothetical protein
MGNEREVVGDLEEAPFIKELVTGLTEHNQGRVMLLTGLPGSGKSMAAARICEKVDPDFSLERISIGDNVEFIRMLKKGLNKEYKPGTAIMGDEMGVIAPARDWNTYGNRITSLTFQIVRKLGLLIVMTTPMRRLIDVHARDMVHYYGNGRGIDYQEKRSTFKLYELVYDDWIHEALRHNLRDQNGNPVNVWKMSLPTCLDVDDYEAKKDKLLGKVLNRAEELFIEIQNREVEGLNGGNGGEAGIRLAPKSPTKKAEEMLRAGIDFITVSDATGIAVNSLTRINRELVKCGVFAEG